MTKSKAFRLLSSIAFVVSGIFAFLTGLLFLDGNNAHGAMAGIAVLSAFTTIASAIVGGLFRLYE